MRAGWLPFLLALLCFGAAVGLIAEAIVHGGATAGVFLIFPFVAGSSPLLALGIVLLIAGFFALFFSAAARATEEDDEDAGSSRSTTASTGPVRSAPASGGNTRTPRVSYGGFLLIGPVPVVFGNRPGWLPYLIAMAVVTLLAIFVFVLALRA
ncbi:MAG: DUF131 domain-containing protein [Euryarchaeota archaeon]|nr:DUF131 domain-containing protein [Euryarchaeota archaeon]MDE1837814.1 DUF131 domain-containing protein [Euryarchaeota archaeon]MDE1880088.1 DUF131 domain-containing protein [Euryarchaeota archaeon]MDE2045074.1 DUF131 domain-containing protein [Thermoplasmata archaeon]